MNLRIYLLAVRAILKMLKYCFRGNGQLYPEDATFGYYHGDNEIVLVCYSSMIWLPDETRQNKKFGVIWMQRELDENATTPLT